MKKLNKKGQIMDNFGKIAVGIAALAFILVIVFMINANVKEQTVSEITATSYTDVAKTLVNTTATEFVECVSDEAMSVTEVLNGTGAGSVALGTGNYTVATNVLTVTTVGGIGYESPANVTYSCRNPSLAYNATGTLNNDTQSFVAWVGLVIIILVGILILGLVKQIRQ